VKDEKQLDKFDRFSAMSSRASTRSKAVNVKDLPEEWLQDEPRNS
jgi:uncharacterized protein with von Willebrand factor type A (vWA) domain